MTPRQLNATILGSIGLLLLMIVEPLAKALAGAPSLLLAGLYLLGPVGFIFLVLGVYRFSTKDKTG